MVPFSVLMSVYKNEKKEYFCEAIDSVLNQTLKPDEIILVRDGKVPDELQKCIDSYLRKNGDLFTYIPFEENKGLGCALREGVLAAKNPIIIRMDTDDISVPDRFEHQISFMELNPDISVLGGQIEEFIDNKENIICKRQVPVRDEAIKKFIIRRNPFNHMTVAFRKQDVIAAGNYMDMHYVEDYYLWLRMLLNDCNFGNLSKTLVYARVGADMYKRRGGYVYFKSLKKLEKFKLDNKIIGLRDYITTLLIRYIVQVVLSNNARGWIYKKFTRASR